MQKYIAILVGSLRVESYNRKMAQNLVKMAPTELQLEIIEIGDLQMYNEDLDKNPPESWVLFRKIIQSFDAILFITPEYNRSVPAVLKNALDVGSRPYGQSVLKPSYLKKKIKSAKLNIQRAVRIFYNFFYELLCITKV